MWKEAMDQVQAVWLSPHEARDANGQFPERSDADCNLSCSFGVVQADKMRGFDDLRDSLANLACAVHTPITLPGWDHIAAATRILAENCRAWSFGKVDHRAAYMALPVTPTDAKYAVITLWCPVKKIRCGFRPRTQLFGSIDAVLHYSRLSRIIASLICRILLIPTKGYFDDFLFFARTPDEALTLAHIAELITLLGFGLKMAKPAIGENGVFPGLSSYFPQPRDQMALAISLPKDKAHRWAQMIISIIDNKSISHATLESLIGRLSLAQTSILGKFARDIPKPLYANLFPTRYFPRLSPSLIRNLKRLGTAILRMRHRAASMSRPFPEWSIYADAAYEPEQGCGCIAAVFSHTDSGPRGRYDELVFPPYRRPLKSLISILLQPFSDWS